MYNNTHFTRSPLLVIAMRVYGDSTLCTHGYVLMATHWPVPIGRSIKLHIIRLAIKAWAPGPSPFIHWLLNQEMKVNDISKMSFKSIKMHAFWLCSPFIILPEA
jgi:hypothetical protein